MREPLDVWLYGTRIATISTTNDDRFDLTWSPEAIERWGVGARVLGAQLPTGGRVVSSLVKNHLDGLLPEGNARVNHAFTASVPADDTFALIRAYGRDTPGAAIFAPAGADDPSREGHYEPISVAEVAERLRTADAYAPADGRLGESSTLPGMVPKITLHREGDQWYACKDGAPSTWILKRSAETDTDLADVIDTEVACLALARATGLTTIDAETVECDGLRAIAVSRYDRVPNLGNARLHQEDLAQAIGLNTQDPNRKFQWGATMPSLRHGADVLRLDGGNPDHLLRLATFSFLIGNTDMHAKNISFIRDDDGAVRLSPAYDIAMHLHHPRDNRRSALDINGKHAMAGIAFEDLTAEGESWRLPRRRAQRVVHSIASQLAEALEAIDRGAHPGVPKVAWNVVEERVARATDPHGRDTAPRRHRAR